MQGAIMDDGSLIGVSGVNTVDQADAEEASPRKYRIWLSNSTRLIRAEECSKICVSKLFLASLITNHFADRIRQAVLAVRERVLRKLGVGGLIALSSVGLTDRVKAACVDLDYGPTRANIESYDAVETIHDGVRKDRKASPSSDSMRVGHTGQSTLSKCCKWLDYHNAGDYIDRGRYYWLDDNRYYYIDARQYNLLGGIGHLLSHSGYPVWHDYSVRWWDTYLGGGIGLLSNMRAKWIDFYGTFEIVDETTHLADKLNTLLDDMCVGHTEQVAIGTFDARRVCRNAGDYTDRGWYYCLDERQYYYLDKIQYNLLGGTSYMLGHPCYPLWHGYDLLWHGRYLRRETGSADEVSEEWVDFYGRLNIFDEPAQPGDKLHAFVADDNSERMRVGQFTVRVEGWYGYMRVVRDNPLTAHKDGALPGEIVTFEVWDESAAGWLYAEILSGLPQWSSHRAQIRVDINAVPEPSSVGLMGLGALGFLTLRDTRNNRRAAKVL